jgi:hypothetical protein
MDSTSRYYLPLLLVRLGPRIAHLLNVGTPETLFTIPKTVFVPSPIRMLLTLQKRRLSKLIQFRKATSKCRGQS